MYISMNWIGDFVDLSGLDLEALIHRFTLSTAEVEDVYHMGQDLRDVVAGKILSVEAHPNSKSSTCSRWIPAIQFTTWSAAPPTCGRA